LQSVSVSNCINHGMNQPKSPTKYLVFSVVLIAIDQLSKLLVHKYMEPGFSGQIQLLGSWLKLHYVLNPGMAFGMQLGHEYGKLFLTLFRLVAMCAIGWYLVRLARSGAATGLLWALAMILAGAVGNVIDSTFYGVWLENAPYGAPTPWFHGQVIDMIFVDFWEGFIPEWVPVWGGQYYSTPIFNIADSCIFVGVCSILIFQGHFNSTHHEQEQDGNEIVVAEESEHTATTSTVAEEEDTIIPVTEPEKQIPYVEDQDEEKKDEIQ
jgi:signal peptidase II